MRNIKISLVLSFRAEHDLFQSMLKSAIDKADEPSSIEVVPVIDDDDLESMKMIDFYVSKYAPMEIKFIVVPRSRWFIRDYYNVGERASSGWIVMNVSADSFFITDGWDSIIYETMFDKLLFFGDGILYGMPDDSLDYSVDEGFSSWAISTRQYINLTGGMMPKEIPMWGADVELGNIFNLIDGGRRKVDLRNVKIIQRSYHVDKYIQVSESAKRFNEMVQKYPAFLTYEQRMRYADISNNYIKTYHEKKNISE